VYQWVDKGDNFSWMEDTMKNYTRSTQTLTTNLNVEDIYSVLNVPNGDCGARIEEDDFSWMEGVMDSCARVEEDDFSWMEDTTKNYIRSTNGLDAKDVVYVLEASTEGYTAYTKGEYPSLAAAKLALEADMYDRCMRNAPHDVVWAEDCSGPYNEEEHFSFGEVAVLEWTHYEGAVYSVVKVFVHGEWEEYIPPDLTLWRITRCVARRK
jgi:hypothetical protein